MSKKTQSNTKDLIINVVEDLISTSGINSFTLRDVAKKCPISLGTLYYYYKTKDEIILDLIRRHLSSLNDEYFSWLERHKDDLSPDRYLDVLFYKGVKLYDRAKIHLFLLNECIGNETLLQQYKAMYQTWRENLKIGTNQVFKNVKDGETFSTLILLIIDGLVVQEVLGNSDDIHIESLKGLIGGMANE